MERFLFSSGEFFYPIKSAQPVGLLNRLNSYIKRILSDGFDVAALNNSIMKSRRLCKTSNVVMHIKTVIAMGNFSFRLTNFVNLSTTFFCSTFFNVSYFS